MGTNIFSIPDKIRGNSLSKILDQFLVRYRQLVQKGKVYGLALVDQDAKVLAVNSFFYKELNYWDIGAIGAALHGIGKQGRDFFHAQAIQRVSMIFEDKQFFVHMIGQVNTETSQVRELILIVIGSQLNIGLIIMMMQKNAQKIKEHVRNDQTSQITMKMSEQEFQRHISALKREMFSHG